MRARRAFEREPGATGADTKTAKENSDGAFGEEMSGLLDQMAGTEGEEPAARANRKRLQELPEASGPGIRKQMEDTLLLPRDRAILELLYAAGLRVSELTGLNLVHMNEKERMLHVRGKGNKERIVPYGEKAAEALRKYWPVRDQLLRDCEEKSRRGSVEGFWIPGTSADAAKYRKNSEEICAAGG